MDQVAGLWHRYKPGLGKEIIDRFEVLIFDIIRHFTADKQGFDIFVVSGFVL